MAGEKLKAAKEIKAFVGMFSNLLAIAPDLEKLGDVEKAVTELQDRMMSLGARKTALEGELDKMLQDIETAKQEALQLRVDAKAEAAATINVAEEAAAKKLKAVRDDIDLLRQDGQRELADLNAQIEAKASALKDAQVAVSSETDKLVKLQKMVADLRSKVGAIA